MKNAGGSNYDAGVLVGSAAYLYANLFVLPKTPFLLGGDQALFWMNAQRLLHGEVIYRDFLEFTPPGTDLIYLGAFRLLGSWVWVSNLVVLLSGVALCWLCFRIALSIMKPAEAALAAALFMVLDYGKMLNGTHHWFSVLAVMAAVAVLLEDEVPARVIIAGTLLGIASFFTQTRGPIAALGIGGYLIWNRFQTQESWSSCLKKLVLLCIFLVATWAALSGYFVARAGFWRLWYFQVTYVLRYYVTSGANDLSFQSPEILAWLRTSTGISFLLAYVTLPLVYAISFWQSRRPMRASASRDAAERARIALLTFAGVAMFIEVAQSPNWIRIYCVAMPGMILTLWLLSVAPKAAARRYAMSLMWIALMGVAVHQASTRHRQQSTIVDLPGGRIATNAPTGEKLAWLARQATPGQFLFEARWVDVYFPLALRNPVFTDMLEGGHKSNPEFIDMSIGELESKRVRYIIWAPRLEAPKYPFAKFHEFLQSQYHRVRSFPDKDEVWERNPGNAIGMPP